MNEQAPSFFVALLNAATQAHLLHLKSKSFSEHKALEELYTGLPDLVDSLVESYQGINGVVESYPPQTIAVSSDALKFVEVLGAFITNNRASVGQQSELQNIIDEIKSLVNSTAYKLANLK